MVAHLAFQSHPRSVKLVDLPLVHLLPLQGEEGAALVLRAALRLGVQQLRLNFLLDVSFSGTKIAGENTATGGKRTTHKNVAISREPRRKDDHPTTIGERQNKNKNMSLKVQKKWINKKSKPKKVGRTIPKPIGTNRYSVRYSSVEIEPLRATAAFLLQPNLNMNCAHVHL